MDLFLDRYTPSIEKVAAEVELPEDPNRWPQEILQELHKQISFISDFDSRIVMDRVDAEKGYGFGHFDVSPRATNPMMTPEDQEMVGMRTARIPIIIEEGKLKPFDLVITQDAKTYPLTESRLRQALFRPNMFDMQAKSPGDDGIVERLYPPFRSSNYVGGSMTLPNATGMVTQSAAGMGKSDMDKTAEEQFSEFVTAGESKEPGFTAWDGQNLETAGAAEQRRRSRGEGDLESAVALGEGVWGKVLSQQNQSAMNYPKQKSQPKPDAQQEYRDRAAYVTKIAKVMKLKTPEPEKIIEGQKAEGFKPKYTGTMGPDGKIKTASVLDSILPTINESDFQRFAAACDAEEVKIACLKNTCAAECLGKLSNWEVTKTASAGRLAKQDVMQVRKAENGYEVKYASSRYWAPTTKVLDRGALYDAIGDSALQVDMSGSLTLTKSAQVLDDGPEADSPEPIVDFGMYKVQATDGRKLIGFAIPNLLDLEGTALPMVLFTNGAVSALQGDMVGVKAGGEPNLPDGPVKGYGSFIHLRDNGKVESTIPIEIKGEVQHETYTTWLGETFDGTPIRISQQPNLKTPVKVGDEVLIPDSFRWMPLTGDTVTIVDNPASFGKQAEAVRHLLTVEVRGGENTYSIDGPPVEKVAASDRHFVDYDGAVFLLGGLGVSPKYAMKKLSQANFGGEPVHIRVARSIKTAEAVERDMRKVAMSRPRSKLFSLPHLVKEAAYIPDSTSIDSVLSLGFINPENIMTFIDNLPSLEASQNRLCEMLLGARLGIKETPEGALMRTVKALEEVLDGLKVLAFQET